MTKVLVTVGTTPFPRLVAFFDRVSVRHDIAIQTADQGQSCVHQKNFTFSPEISTWYDWADLIVTHAGAGTVFSLLERGKRLAVVPNLDRSDTHQSDLAEFVHEMGYALVVNSLGDYESPDEMITAALGFDARRYDKTPFTAAEALLRLLHFNAPLIPPI